MASTRMSSWQSKHRLVIIFLELVWNQPLAALGSTVLAGTCSRRILHRPQGTPMTGKPHAKNPPVRFGRRSGSKRPSLPLSGRKRGQGFLPDGQSPARLRRWSHSLLSSALFLPAHLGWLLALRATACSPPLAHDHAIHRLRRAIAMRLPRQWRVDGSTLPMSLLTFFSVPSPQILRPSPLTFETKHVPLS